MAYSALVSHGFIEKLIPQISRNMTHKYIVCTSSRTPRFLDYFPCLDLGQRILLVVIQFVLLFFFFFFLDIKNYFLHARAFIRLRI
jgi:hypothetical protein